MKRSRAIRLALMGGGALALAGCAQEPQEEVAVFRDYDDCTADDALDDALCWRAAERAGEVHETAAPRYTSLDACEDDFGPGACDGYRDEGGGFFVPAFVGFMLGRAIGDRAGWAPQSARPLYRTRNANFLVDAEGDEIDVDFRKRRGRTALSKLTGAVPRARVLSRGGFGRSGFSFTGGG